MHHTFANGLRFGPDGWLFGRCGASSSGEMGVPGTPEEQRIPLRGTMWRYHPQRKVVEALSSGTTNRGAWLNSVHKRKLVRLEKRVRVFLPR